MMDNNKLEKPLMFFDEASQMFPASFEFGRLASYTRFHSGLPIGERFNDRFDTLVGGVLNLVTQRLTDEPSDVPSESKVVAMPSLIVDFANGQRREITPEEAENMPECAEVLVRLKERVQLLAPKKSTPEQFALERACELLSTHGDGFGDLGALTVLQDMLDSLSSQDTADSTQHNTEFKYEEFSDWWDTLSEVDKDYQPQVESLVAFDAARETIPAREMTPEVQSTIEQTVRASLFKAFSTEQREKINNLPDEWDIVEVSLRQKKYRDWSPLTIKAMPHDMTESIDTPAKVDAPIGRKTAVKRAVLAKLFSKFSDEAQEKITDTLGSWEIFELTFKNNQSNDLPDLKIEAKKHINGDV